MSTQTGQRSGAQDPIVGGQGDPDSLVDIRDNGAPSRAAEKTAKGSAEPETTRQAQLRELKFFGSPAFRRLWFAQLASALGDWIGIVAITAIASRLGGDGIGGLGGVSLVLAARLIPGFFLSPFVGVLVDKWERRHVMVVTGLLRAAVLCMLPLVDTLLGLVLASLVLELATLMWSTAKEASVPNIVRRDYLATANSLSLAAAYGPLLIAGGLYALFVKIPDWLDFHAISDESLSLFFNALMYTLSAVIIWTLKIPHEKRGRKPEHEDKGRAAAGMAEAREGLSYVIHNVRVRTVVLGLATGLIGGAMLVPLGSQYASIALNAGSAGYGLLLNGLGMGVASGVLLVNVVHRKLPLDRTFIVCVFGAGAMLLLTSTMQSLSLAVVFVTVMGLFAGALYVIGYSNIQVNSSDEMRGRVFATLYAATRVCVLAALFAAPLIAIALDSFSNSALNGGVNLFGDYLPLPGVRLTLMLGGIIILFAGFLALFSLRKGMRSEEQ